MHICSLHSKSAYKELIEAIKYVRYNRVSLPTLSEVADYLLGNKISSL